MTPLPKRRHSHRRTGLRRSQTANHLKAEFPKLCANCGQPRFSHMACPSCGEYKGKTYRI